MAYLLALIFPIAFLYSPRVEKSNLVMVTKPLTITQERNTPAYLLFQQTQLIQKNIQNSRIMQLRQLANQEHTTELSTEHVIALTAKAPLAEIQLNKTELAANTDRQLQALFTKQPEDVVPTFTPETEGAVIRGQFELKDGVGIVDHVVVLKRMFEGQAIEVGQVDLKAGQYQIAVGAFEGEIVAEVKDTTGVVIGEDHERLYNLKRSGQFYEGPALRLGRPAAFAFNPRAVDDLKLKEQHLQASFFSGHYDLKKTTDVYPNVARHSSTLGIIEDSTGGTVTTLSVRAAADQSETVLFSQKWVDGAVSYLSEQLQLQYLPDTGVIIGRVMMDGKPVRGAQVLIENQPGLEPYYLDQFLIPQTKQSTTSDNGYFIIPGLSRGVYEISSSIGERNIGSQQFMVEAEIVSYQEIYSSSIPQSIVARSFDVLSGENVQTEIFVPGQKDIISIEESGLARYRNNSMYGLTEVVNRPLERDYAAYVYIQSQSKDHLHLPQVKDSFIEYAQAQGKIEVQPNSSIFIGFTPENNFDVNVADQEYNPANLLFFDRLGNLTAQQTPGGGFIAFNVREGIQEIILQDQKTDRSYSTVIYSRPSVLFVSHFEAE